MLLATSMQAGVARQLGQRPARTPRPASSPPHMAIRRVLILGSAVALTVAHVEKLREMSPLWEMVQEGIDIKSIQWSQH